jgi:S-adenosylmethionine hydrolase
VNVSNRIITLTTDFGTKDGYVAALKGTILSITSDVLLIDVSHNISPQDIMEAAYVLKRTAPLFPPSTIHLVVVDPEIGENRRPVGLKFGGQSYVGPNNGLFSLILSGSKPDQLIELTNSSFWREQAPSIPFNARDIMAPAAAHLANGVALSNLGSPGESLYPMHWALPITDQQGIQGWIVHIDRFGNCVTNIHRRVFEEILADRSYKCYVGNSVLNGHHGRYSQAESGDPVLLFNSDDILEIAINRGSAAMLLDIPKGAPVNIVFGDEKTVTTKSNGRARG